MNLVGSGFITIMIYAGMSNAATEQFALITESGSNILTETSQDILIESAP